MTNTITAHAGAILGVLPAFARSNAILAGGALRAYFDKTPIKDCDLFFRTHEDFLDVCAELSEHPLFTEVDCPNGTRTFHHLNGHIFNLIGFHFATPVDHVQAFDFRCCQMAAWFDSRDAIQFHAEPEAIFDAEAKVITVMNNNGEDRTVSRVERYIDGYGYKLHDGDEVVAEELAEEMPVGSPRLALNRIMRSGRIRRVVGRYVVTARGY